MKLTVNSERTLSEAIETLRSEWGGKKYIEIEVFSGKRRTDIQNRALHLWLSMLADTLNEAGLDMKKVIKPEVDIPWSKESCKDFLWRPIQKAVTGKESTTECKTVEYGEIQEVLVRHLQEKFGIECPPWPERGME